MPLTALQQTNAETNPEQHRDKNSTTTNPLSSNYQSTACFKPPKQGGHRAPRDILGHQLGDLLVQSELLLPQLLDLTAQSFSGGLGRAAGG